jgi:VWFA-related protein
MKTTHRPRRRLSALAFAAALALCAAAPGFATSSAQDKGATPAPTPQPSPAADDVDQTDLVTTTVAVTNGKGAFVTGLTRESFAVFEGKNQRPVVFFRTEEEPQSVGVVFDISRSMSPLALAEGRLALLRFMQQAHPSNEYFIIGFESKLHPLTQWTRDGKTIMEALTQLRLIEPEEGTILYDACAAGLEKLVRGSNPLKVLLVVSDGQDSLSKTGFSRVREMVRRSGVLVYAVGVVSEHDDGMLGTAGRAILEEMAVPSGGRAYFPSRSAELEDTFDRIGLELHTQYHVGFAPEKHDGKWHEFKVKVTPPEKLHVYVRSRGGYYAEKEPD